MKVLDVTGESVKNTTVMNKIKKAVKTGNTAFFVHASWCPYTVQFYPIWTAMEAKLKESTDFNIIKLDHESFAHIKKAFPKVYETLADYDEYTQSYKLYFPSVVMFTNGIRKKYSPSERTLTSLVAFIKKYSTNKTPNATKHTKPAKTTTQHAHLKLHQQIDKAFSRLMKK